MYGEPKGMEEEEEKEEEEEEEEKKKKTIQKWRFHTLVTKICGKGFDYHLGKAIRSR